MNLKQMTGGNDIDESLAALLANANAVRAITGAVEGTIGPKGLDTMLVDRFGEDINTNDGVTIHDKMDVNHPAAKMLINIAKAQQAEIGDGTTTASVLAGALIGEGVAQVLRGVPVSRVIEGVKIGTKMCLEILDGHSRKIEDLNSPILRNIAMIAGRENEDIAELVLEAARLIGQEKLHENNFKLSDIIISEAGAQNEVFMGVIIDRERMSSEMPEQVNNAKLLLIDDGLEPEELGDEALGTEAGFKRFMDLQEEFKVNVKKIVDLGVTAVFVDRAVHEAAEEILSDAGVLVVQRVAGRDLRRTAEHCGARMIKRTGLRKSIEDLKKYLGSAEQICEDEKLQHIRVVGGRGKPMATILVSAATAEVVGERERIAKDAASSVQAAVRGGYVPGGGALEIAIASEIKARREELKGMSAYGLDCVVKALERPLSQIVDNAGFNHLEKLEEVIAAQRNTQSDSIGIDCDSGKTMDMLQFGIIDPTLVKRHAIKAAGEVAVAILRIDTIIKKKDESDGARAADVDSEIRDY